MGVRDERAAATRAKLLEAAREEFQQDGFAGARIDRIAERSGMNKRLIYAHFGSKAELFDIVIADNVARVVDAVPFEAADLAGYAVRLHDYWVAQPTSVRLFSWRNVELGHAPQFEDETYRSMIEQIERAGAAEKAGVPAAHLLALTFAVLLAWSIPAGSLDGPDSAVLEARRRSIRLTVERLLDGDDGPGAHREPRMVSAAV